MSRGKTTECLRVANMCGLYINNDNKYGTFPFDKYTTDADGNYGGRGFHDETLSNYNGDGQNRQLQIYNKGLVHLHVENIKERTTTVKKLALSLYQKDIISSRDEDYDRGSS